MHRFVTRASPANPQSPGQGFLGWFGQETEKLKNRTIQNAYVKLAFKELAFKELDLKSWIQGTGFKELDSKNLI